MDTQRPATQVAWERIRYVEALHDGVWGFARQAVANGTVDDPEWPPLDVTPCTVLQDGCEREAAQQETIVWWTGYERETVTTYTRCIAVPDSDQPVWVVWATPMPGQPLCQVP